MASTNSTTAPATLRIPTLVADDDVRDAESLIREFDSMPQEDRSLAQILLDDGILAAHVAPMLADLPVPHLRRMLIEELEVAEEDVQRAAARTLGVPCVDPTVFKIERAAIDAVQASIARQHVFIPLCFTTRGLVVAVEDADDSNVKAALALNTQSKVELVVATRGSIERAIAAWYGPEDDRQAFDEIGHLYKVDGAADKLDLETGTLGNEKPVVRLVHNLLLDAIQHRASDIHIRPLEESVEILFRLDGALVKMRSFSKSMLGTVVSRIKIIGNMDISEHRQPQDGRFRILHKGDDIDFRLSTIPTVQGESVVIRVLNSKAGLLSIDQLGLSDLDDKRFSGTLGTTSGLVLITGPTGCGKSTTLYAAIKEVSKRIVSIVTVEDPVESRLEGVNQIQVNAAAGMTFPRILKHILRHDPDVIMVGEIRDEETAKLAVESSLTGHLVLSTLHTNDATSAIARLLDMGIAPYLLKSSLSAVLAQRLVRLNCRGCIEPETVDTQVQDILGVDATSSFFRGKGCLRCHGTGYVGRRAVYELLPISREIRELIGNTSSGHDIEQLAIQSGMQPLSENALALANTGETSLAEVFRIRLGD